MDIKPLPPSFLGVYNLSTSDVGCCYIVCCYVVTYIVNNFLVFLSIASSSLLLQLTNAAEYLNRDTAQVLTPRTKFPPFNFDFKTFIVLIYSCGHSTSSSLLKIYLPLKLQNTCNFHLPVTTR